MYNHFYTPILWYSWQEYVYAVFDSLLLHSCGLAIGLSSLSLWPPQVDDAVIVYLDSDTVECRLVEPSSLPQLPQQAVAIFKQRYRVHHACTHILGVTIVTPN